MLKLDFTICSGRFERSVTQSLVVQKKDESNENYGFFNTKC